MNRKMRREMQRREKADETAAVKRLIRTGERTIKKVVKQERQAITERYGLDDKGMGVEEYHTATETLGSVTCLSSGGDNRIEYAAITASPATLEQQQAFINQLTRSYDNMDLPVMHDRGVQKVYFGGKVKVVLSQIRGDFWTVYLGSEGLVDKFIETGAIAVELAASGYAAFWNEWEIRVSESTIALWENLMGNLQAIFFHALEWPHREGKVMRAFDMFIPSENVIIQREGEVKIQHERQVHPTGPRKQWQEGR